MKKVLMVVLVMLLLSGCKVENQELDRMMSFRASLLAGVGCQFKADITADYKDEQFQFALDCRSDEQGNLRFEVVEPESISGIRGVIAGDGGKVTFDNDTVLAFETLVDGQVSPVSAPWLLIKTLRGGYVMSCGKEDDMMRVSIDDSYQDDALRLDIWFNDADEPSYAEILWDDRRILSLNVTNFEIL